MYQAPLPPEYARLTEDEAAQRITAARQALGSRLVILGHHYQRDEVIQHADFRGDSYKLAKHAQALPDAEFIVFCGVHFMAESADILTAEHQKVILPNLAAGCSMADMANIIQVRRAWQQLAETLGDIEAPGSAMEDPAAPADFRETAILPITYINSAANLKAFVGEHGGIVCTSTNAPEIVTWALKRAGKILFFPDQHLGRNTGIRLGYDPDNMVVWDPFKPLGGNTAEQIQQAKFILWKGHCSVHKRFTVEQIAEARAKHPDVTVVVHPECPMEVVQAADQNGSTEFIVNTITRAEPGTTWAVGTEINLVARLANENPDKKVFCLDPHICPCSTMYRIHPSFLCWVLERLVAGEVVNQVSVPEGIAEWARISLQRMLDVTAAPVRD